MMRDLRFDCVRVGRKCRTLHQDLKTRFGRPIKRRHHQMEIHREAVHADHFQRLRADKPRGRFAQCFMIRVPRCAGRVVRVDPKLRPVVELLLRQSPGPPLALGLTNCRQNRSAVCHLFQSGDEISGRKSRSGSSESSCSAKLLLSGKSHGRWLQRWNAEENERPTLEFKRSAEGLRRA